MKNIVFKKEVGPDDPGFACEFLASMTGLSKSRVKDAMNKGAAWLKRKNRKRKRVRKAKALLKAGDYIEFCYDEKILAVKPPLPECLKDQKRYSLWFKPPGLLTQGTEHGDHCSLLRQAELHFKPPRKVFPIHRLDREASGLVLIAHDKAAASKLSMLFKENKIFKRYRIEVRGNLAGEARGKITQPLDGKAAVTEFVVDKYDPEKNTSIVDVVIRTGRRHQIRRHFEIIGFPVMGDPKYGDDNKNKDGMKIIAIGLTLQCPFNHREVVFELDQLRKIAGKV